MTIEQAVMENLKVLSPDKKQKVLEFTEFLTARKQIAVTAHENDLDLALSQLNENELTHLEMEFENYEQLYPRQ